VTRNSETDSTPDVLSLEAFLPYRLVRAAEDVSRRFWERYRRLYGLTRPEWRTFATIGEFRRITATAVGQHSSMHKTKVSRAVAALEHRRWITRSTDSGDRRIEHLELTREGHRRYAELVAVALAFERDLVDALGADASAALDRGLAALEVHETSVRMPCVPGGPARDTVLPEP
jgi:DNA-binding MarR family transcriptional regulator